MLERRRCVSRAGADRELDRRLQVGHPTNVTAGKPSAAPICERGRRLGEAELRCEGDRPVGRCDCFFELRARDVGTRERPEGSNEHGPRVWLQQSNGLLRKL